MQPQPQLTLDEVCTAIHASRDPTSLYHYIQGFLLAQERHTPRTRAYYEENLSKFVWWLLYAGHPTTLRDITPTHIRLFMQYLRNETGGRWGLTESRARKPLKPRTIHIFARSLRAFFNWAAEEAPLPKSPFPKDALPKLPNEWRVETYTDEEIRQMFAVLEQGSNPMLIARNRALLTLLLDTGLRAAEVLSVTCEQASGGAFTIEGKGGKRRPVILGNTSQKAIWHYLTHHRLKMQLPTDALFITEAGTPLTYWGLKELCQTLQQKTGITRIPIRPHNFRHTFATNANRSGMRGVMLQKLLGHANFDTTSRYYLDITEEDLAAEHAKHAPLDSLRLGKPRPQPTAPAPQLPPAQELLVEVKATSYKAVARKYGVSDTTIHKRLRKAGIHP